MAINDNNNVITAPPARNYSQRLEDVGYPGPVSPSSGSIVSQGTQYSTIAAAVAASASGTLIQLGAGTYNERNIAKTGVDISGPSNTQLVYTGDIAGAIIDDNERHGTGGTLITTITTDLITNEGTGAFSGVESGLEGDPYSSLTAVVSLTYPNSIVTLNAKTVGSAHDFDGTTVGITINQSDGRLTVNAGRILCGNFASAVYWWDLGGELVINFDEIVSTDTGALGLDQGAIVTSVATATGELYMRGNKVTNLLGAACFEHQADDATARCWFVGIADIRGGAKAITNASGTPAGKYYYIGCGKITAALTSSTVIYLIGGTYWMDFQKLTTAASATYGLHVAGAVTLNMELMELETLGAVTNIALINHASANVTLSIQKCVGHASAGGIQVTLGKLRLNNSYINTVANVSTAPLNGAASQTIYLHAVKLVTGAAASIVNSTGSGTLTVVCTGGCTANVAVGANVTVVGELSVDVAFV